MCGERECVCVRACARARSVRACARARHRASSRRRAEKKASRRPSAVPCSARCTCATHATEKAAIPAQLRGQNSRTSTEKVKIPGPAQFAGPGIAPHGSARPHSPALHARQALRRAVQRPPHLRPTAKKRRTTAIRADNAPSSSAPALRMYDPRITDGRIYYILKHFVSPRLPRLRWRVLLWVEKWKPAQISMAHDCGTAC